MTGLLHALLFDGSQEELGARSAQATNKRLYVLALITAVFLPLGFVCALFSAKRGWL